MSREKRVRGVTGVRKAMSNIRTPKILTASAMMSLIALIAIGPAAPALAVSDKPLDVDIDTLAKIAKQRSKKFYDPKANAEHSDQNGGKECGALNIGTFQSDGKSSRAPREITVVVTGDVINAFNDCK
jgi:hypothetical protein